MKVATEKSKKQKHEELMRKYGKSKFKSSKQLRDAAGIWKGRDISIEEIRDKGWRN